MIEATHPAGAVSVTRLIDEGRLTSFQIGTIVCCALVSMFDGIDTQSIGVAAPFIADTLGIKIASFGPIFSSALVGATIGAASFGPLADRLGRKTLLLVAVVLIGVFTILTALADSVGMLMLCRLMAGLGLGGATPCYIALTSEYAPARSRATLVTLMWSAFPLGGMLGGLLNSYLLVAIGWRAIFYIGGVAPLLFGLFLLWYLPESLKFLLLRRNDTAAVAAIIARLRVPIDAAKQHFIVEEKNLPGVAIKHLFTEGRALGTLFQHRHGRKIRIEQIEIRDIASQQCRVSKTYERILGRHLGHGDRALRKLCDVDSDVIGRNNRLPLSDENTKPHVVSFRSFGFLDRTLAHLDAERYRASGKRVRRIRTAAAGCSDETFGEIGQRGRIKERGHRYLGIDWHVPRETPARRRTRRPSARDRLF